jgi:hypothetical protein
VRTAALGKVTIISGVKEDPVVLALDRKTTEPQQIKYRMILSDEEVRTSELEIVAGETVLRTPGSAHCWPG